MPVLRITFAFLLLPLFSLTTDSGEADAEFPGGKEALRRFVAEHLLYPASLGNITVEGTCYLKFIVTKEGRIADIAVVRGIPDCPECDAAAVAVFRHPDMPLWIPKKINGQPVDSELHYPIRFKIE